MEDKFFNSIIIVLLAIALFVGFYVNQEVEKSIGVETERQLKGE